MTPEVLLEELEPLTHADRVRRLVSLGRRATDADAAETIARLEAADDTYARFLALLTCFTSLDGAHVLRALEDASRLVRGKARRLAPLVCTDAQLEQALARARPREVGPLLRRLRRAHRQPPIDAFVAALVAAQHVDAPRWLAFASADVVERHLA